MRLTLVLAALFSFILPLARLQYDSLVRSNSLQYPTILKRDFSSGILQENYKAHLYEVHINIGYYQKERD